MIDFIHMIDTVRDCRTPHVLFDIALSDDEWSQLPRATGVSGVTLEGSEYQLKWYVCWNNYYGVYLPIHVKVNEAEIRIGYFVREELAKEREGL